MSLSGMFSRWKKSEQPSESPPPAEAPPAAEAASVTEATPAAEAMPDGQPSASAEDGAPPPPQPPPPQPQAVAEIGEPWQEGQVILSDFEVVQIGSSGSLGTVYTVVDTSINRRFAVKRIKSANVEAQTKILAELEAWMYLPEHPHLVGCRFARLMGDEVVIFLDCVDAPPLAELIASKRLYSKDPARILERLLDIAIQFAWGLDAIHDMALMHQNVKPANVFVLSSGIVKITDISLVRAASLGLRKWVQGGQIISKSIVCYRPPGQEDPRLGQSLISAGQITQEQLDNAVKQQERGDSRLLGEILIAENAVTEAAVNEILEQQRENGQLLIHASDIWNYGAAVLEMFVPGLKADAEWIAKAQTLTNLDIVEHLQKANDIQAPFPAMPASLAAILRRCFETTSGRCWPTLGAAADALRQVYLEVTKKAYPRRTPTPLHRGNLLAIAHARWQPGGGAQWTPPEEWMEKATGVHTRTKPSRQRGSRKQQAQADMEGYEKAQKVFEKELAQSHKERDLQYLYAIFRFEKAFLHVSLNELPAALENFDKTIQILNEMVAKEGRTELSNDLAMVYLNRAVALKNMDKLEESLAVYAKAIEIWERLVKNEARLELNANMAWAKALRGEALFKFADETQRLADDLERRAEEAKSLAQTYEAARDAETNPAKVLARSRDIQEQIQAAKKFGAEAATIGKLARERITQARKEAPGGLTLLRSEVRRTVRDDLKAILRWAETVFEGRV